MSHLHDDDNDDNTDYYNINNDDNDDDTTTTSKHYHHNYGRNIKNRLQRIGGQIPAVALLGIFHLMVGIPFGVSYFPVDWRVGADIASGVEEGVGDGDGDDSSIRNYCRNNHHLCIEVNACHQTTMS
eukprot:5323498-Ditylum_brightwellii.AAC.1